ncbi:DUF3631 domain-containing protein [Bradyrhizobium quebecense]|uniref:DUF3631 domain-containing protein n=2 Tax=Bradyrhizobium quebecense TaxID=2748629 RepID=A0ACD3VGI5_9BRAD|nr:DUF3631 domain-containing protein [Bradyrhizobium quebecense]UGY05087.1 DUF3631 domain-containing protein [Bradyrhizobium quebecense]
MIQETNILKDVYDYVGRFISYPSEHARIAHVAWIAHTYLLKSFYATPRLTVLSPEKRSGKTRLLEITKLLVQNPQGMVSPSPASLYTLIECLETTPTLLIDEIGRLLERKDIGEFVAIVEAGFQPGHTVPRVTLDGTRRVENFAVYAPILMAGIDNNRMPDTVLDRSITLRMRRHIGPRLKYRNRDANEGHALAARLAAWAASVSDRASGIEPIMPDDLNDREQDKWEPLFIVGRLADLSETDVTDVTDVTDDFGWEQRIRKAALALSNEDKEGETPSNSEALLRDIYGVFYNEFSTLDCIRTTDLLDKLNCLEEAPWSSYLYGRPLDGRGLAKILRPHNIKRTTIRFDGKPDKGYHRSDFEDAFNRYLGHPKTTVTRVTAVTSVTSNPSFRDSENPSTLSTLDEFEKELAY